jgi:hypothetical protein
MTMKIENYEGSADSFSWTYNPNVADYQLDVNAEITQIPFSNRHIVVSGAGFAPKVVVLTGHTSGTNIWTDFRAIGKHVAQSAQIKKLYFESDKFLLVIGKQIKQVHTGGRSMFIDYVATFQSLIGILFGETAKTTGTNGGTATTYIESITGTVTTGGSDITITDGTNSFKVITSGGDTGSAFVFSLVKMADSGRGISVSEYRYCTIAGTRTRNISTTAGTGFPVLAYGINVTTIITTNLTTPIVTYRDGYYM